MQETVIVEPYQGETAYDKSYGVAVTYQPSTGDGWYVEPGYRRVTDGKGEEVVASAFAVAPASASVPALSRVTWQERPYVVIDAQPLRQGGSVHHQEVYLQSTGARDGAVA